MGRVLPLAELDGLGKRLRAEGMRVVFTNGHFDLLHVELGGEQEVTAPDRDAVEIEADRLLEARIEEGGADASQADRSAGTRTRRGDDQVGRELGDLLQITDMSALERGG